MAIRTKAPKNDKYSKKKHDNFVVSQYRTPIELKRRLKRHNRPWSQLPSDLLSEVMSSLSLSDQIRFRSVCKSFLLPIRDNRPVHKLPWRLTYDWDRVMKLFRCKLFDRIGPNPYSVDEIVPQDIDIASISEAEICASKQGWLLFSWQKRTNLLTSFFLFSPFTKQIMTLPDLDSRVGCQEVKSHTPIATFSSDPNCPDCIFFFLRQYTWSTIAISTCKRGDGNWITRVFGGPQTTLSIRDVVHAGGLLYCVSACGFLAAYSVADHGWTILCNPELRLWDGSKHLLECDGELLLVHMDTSFIRESETDQCRLFKFNWSTMAWVSQTSLENQALFLGCSSFLVSVSGPMRKEANKVYYKAANRKLKFYSFEDGKSHYCEPSGYSGWFAVVKLWQKAIWIDPPQLPTQHSPEKAKLILNSMLHVTDY